MTFNRILSIFAALTLATQTSAFAGPSSSRILNATQVKNGSGAVNIPSSGSVSFPLSIANGGTGQTAATGALNALLPTQTGNANKVLKTDGTNASWGAGSGAGGVNFIGQTTTWDPTNVDDRSLDASVGNWLAFADAAASTPVDLTGGSPNVTCTRGTSDPLDGTASLLITKGAANRQGEGCSVVFNVQPAYQGTSATVTMAMSVVSGSIVGGDAILAAYNVTKSQLILMDGNFQVMGTNVVATFPLTAKDSTPVNHQYRLGIYFASTATTAVTLKADNFSISPGVITPVSQATFYGSLLSAGTANCNWTVTTSTPATFSADSDCPVPSVSGSVTAPATKVPGLVIQGPGRYVVHASGATWRTTSAGDGSLSYYLSDGTISSSAATATILTANDHTSTTPVTGSFTVDITDGSPHTFVFYVDTNDGAATTTLANSYSGLQNSGLQFQVFRFPTTSEGILSSSSTFKISSYLANGSRVSGSAPTALGQYRSYLRNSSAQTYTETNGSPTATPSATDGIRIYNGGAFSAADTNNEPTFYEVFVGKNKQIKWDFYASAGRTGNVDAGYIPVSSTVLVGYARGYDPTTGVAWIKPNYFSGSETSHNSGFNSSGGFANDIYFDITVSENALAVGIQSPRSKVVADTGNGHGSTNTKIRRFTNASTTGTAITYADSAANGSTFTINEDGIYAISYSDTSSGNDIIGVSLNSSNNTTNINSLTIAQGKLALSGIASANTFGQVSWSGYLPAGSVIRPHNNPSALGSTDSTIFTIAKVAN